MQNLDNMGVTGVVRFRFGTPALGLRSTRVSLFWLPRIALSNDAFQHRLETRMIASARLSKILYYLIDN